MSPSPCQPARACGHAWCGVPGLLVPCQQAALDCQAGVGHVPQRGHKGQQSVAGNHKQPVAVPFQHVLRLRPGIAPEMDHIDLGMADGFGAAAKYLVQQGGIFDDEVVDVLQSALLADAINRIQARDFQDTELGMPPAD